MPRDDAGLYEHAPTGVRCAWCGRVASFHEFHEARPGVLVGPAHTAKMILGRDGETWVCDRPGRFASDQCAAYAAQGSLYEKPFPDVRSDVGRAAPPPHDVWTEGT